jgi:hypothetical protein
MSRVLDCWRRTGDGVENLGEPSPELVEATPSMVDMSDMVLSATAAPSPAATWACSERRDAWAVEYVADIVMSFKYSCEKLIGPLST